MFKMERAILNLLQNQISIDNKRIPIVRRNKPLDTTPCITINQATNSEQERTIVTDPYEKIRYKYNSELWVNVWCNTEEQRHEIIRQIHIIINQAMANHYLRCANYDNGECTSINSECQALNLHNGRSSKNQCPNPKDNNYTSFFKKNNIFKPTFMITGESDLDDDTINPPVLRTLIKLNMTYYDYYNVGGILFEEIEVEK